MAKLENLKTRLAEIQKRINEEKRRLKKKEFQKRERQIKIIGAYFLDKITADGSFKKIIKELDKSGKLKKQVDRIAFNLKTFKSPDKKDE